MQETQAFLTESEAREYAMLWGGIVEPIGVAWVVVGASDVAQDVTPETWGASDVPETPWPGNLPE